MVLFPFHWTTQFKYLLVAFPYSELLRRFCHSLGAPLLPVPGWAAEGGTGAALLSREALPKKLCMCSARQSWQRARLCNRLLFLLMDNSLLEMKYETFADNGCPRSMVTVIWPSRMQPVTCNYYQQKSYGLIMCHLCSQNAGSAASIHLHWPAVQVLSASWYQAKSRCPGVSWGTAGPGWKPHSTVLSVPGFPADYIPGVKEKINMLIKLKRRKK